MSYIPNRTKFFTKGSISGLATGATLIDTTDANRGRFIVEYVKVVPRTVAGVVVLAPVVNVGFTPTTYSDISSASSLTVATVYANMNMPLAANTTAVPPGTALYVNVAAAGTGYTTYIFDIYVKGFYENPQ